MRYCILPKQLVGLSIIAYCGILTVASSKATCSTPIQTAATAATTTTSATSVHKKVFHASVSSKSALSQQQKQKKVDSINTSSSSSSSSNSNAPVVVPVTTKIKKDKITSRRPLVDAGLRYSSHDWLLTMLLTPTSFILRRIRFHLLTNVVCCIIILYLQENYFPNMKIPMTGHAIVAASLGLLLSHRTDSAYDRFWEARGHWTDTKSICRNTAMAVRAHLEPYAPMGTQKFLNLLAAYPATLMHLCLGGAAKLPDHAQQYIPLANDNMYQEQPAFPAILMIQELHKTLHEIERESSTVNKNLVEADMHGKIIGSINSLLEHMSNCEKILRTPVPLSYSRHTSRFLSAWLGTLPFALIGENVSKYIVLPIVIAAGYCMLGIEEIGHLIEQPFVGDPLDGDEKLYVSLDEDGEESEVITKGRTTMPYDIGIPVCSLAHQIRKEVEAIARQ